MATLSTSAALKESMRRRAAVAGRAVAALAAVPGAFLRLLVKPSPQAPEVWPLYAAQHRAANQAMVSLLQATPAPAPKPAAASPAKPAAPAKAEPGSPRSVLRTPVRAGATPRACSTGSSADSIADSVSSHPLEAEAAKATAAAPARRGRSGFAAGLAKTLVPLAVIGVTAAAGMQHRARRPSPASRKAQANRFPEPKQVPYADPKPAAYKANA